jgi:DNA polymerase-1
MSSNGNEVSCLGEEGLRIIIDADTYIYQAMNAATHDVEFAPDQWFAWCDHAEAEDVFNKSLKQITDKYGDDYLLCLTDYTKENFRKSIHPDYKGNRVSAKPFGYRAFRERLCTKHETLSHPTLEGDDVLGIVATAMGAGDCYILSHDKDMKSIPGFHIDPSTLDCTFIKEKDAKRFHLFQTLTGDRTDNYFGCPGIGPVKADKILGDEPTWEKVKEAYEANGLTEADALVQARLAYILQADHYDEKKGEVILWTP